MTEIDQKVAGKSKDAKQNGRTRRLIGWLLLAFFSALVIAFICNPWQFAGFLSSAAAPLNDTVYASPDGAYDVAVRNVDTGAVGSFSNILLKSKWSVFPWSGQGVVADGPLQFFGPIRWTGNRSLQIGYGASERPDPSWQTKWHDVRIVYVSTP